VLTPQEIDELIDIMKALVEEGKSIILITHKLKEICRAENHCTHIKKGKRIGTVEVTKTNTSELASLMVGRNISFELEKKPANPKDTILKIEALVVKDSRKVETVKGLHLDVKAGESVGIAGIDGNGQTELIEAITGLTKSESGSIKLNGKVITNLPPRNVAESGLGHIPQDRHKHGLVLDMSIGENIGLQTYYQQPYSKGTVLNYKEIYKKADE